MNRRLESILVGWTGVFLCCAVFCIGMWSISTAPVHKTLPVSPPAIELGGSGSYQVDANLFTIAALAKEVTVRIQTETSVGSGIMFNRYSADKQLQTFVWTCRHVIKDEDSTNGSFLLPGGEVMVTARGVRVPARVIAVGGPYVDVALLWLEHPMACVPPVHFNFDVPTVAETVGATSYAEDFPGDPSFVAGIVSATDRVHDGDLMDQLECPFFPGSSGAGIFNTKGECVGLVRVRMSDGVSFDIPARLILMWARDKHYMWAFDDAVPLPANF